MHSEHILKERSDAQNVVSRFPCGMQPFYTTLNIHRARGPMDAIGPSAPQAQVPTGILESAAQVPIPIPTAQKGA